MTQETIVTAAISYKGRVWTLPRPARHIDVMRKIWEHFGVSPDASVTLQCDVVGYESQGFVTSEGRFVERPEAAKIALAAGQLPKLNWPPNLYSEDLW